jgi:inner membrane protein
MGHLAMIRMAQSQGTTRPTRLVHASYRPVKGRASETSVLGHVAVGMALGRAKTPYAHGRVAIASMAWFTALALLPDIDLLPGASEIGGPGAFAHRGATHSLLLAAAVGASCGFVARMLNHRDWLAFGLLCAAAMGSHDVLDAFSESDLRLQLLWPVSSQGYLAPWHPLPIPLLGAALFTERGVFTVVAEVAWFLPVWLYALWPRRGGRALGVEPASSRVETSRCSRPVG